MTRDHLTYRFPRTLVQAFGTDARSAVAIERHRRPLQQRVSTFMKAVGMAGVFVVMVLYGLEALV